MASSSLLGVDETIAKFQGLGLRLRRKILTRAGNAGSKVLLGAIKSATPIDSNAQFAPGLLRRSMGRAVKVYGAKGIMWFGVGPRMDFKEEGPVRVKGRRKGQVKKKIPYLYGRVANAKGGRWKDQAAEAVKDAVLAAIEDTLREELERL